MCIKNVILDFGHGGIDSNGNYTTAPAKMYKFPNGDVAYEGVLNREIGASIYWFLKTHIETLNVVTTIDQNNPADASLSHRVNIANSYPSSETIFVSIHNNASKYHNASGGEIFTSKGKTKADELATSIFDEMKKMYKQYNLKMRADYDDGDPDKESNFYVLRKTKCPAVLIECGFFDNRKDFDLLKDPDFQTELGYYISQGIINYIKKN